jgi:hypothetical protein
MSEITARHDEILLLARHGGIDLPPACANELAA